MLVPKAVSEELKQTDTQTDRITLHGAAIWNPPKSVKRSFNVTRILYCIGAEFVILPGMRKLYDVKIKTLPFDCL